MGKKTKKCECISFKPLIRIDGTIAVCEQCGNQICDECGLCRVIEKDKQ